MAIDSVIRLRPEATGVDRRIQNTSRKAKELEKAVGGANRKLGVAQGKMVGVGRAATVASRGVNALSGAVGKLAAAFAGIQTFRVIFGKTAELETQTRSLQVLTGSLENAKAIIGELQAFGRVTPFTSSELIETAKRLKAFGFETNQVVDVTKRLADVAGATGADLGGIATAFGQIQAKGRLQGEELLQLQERGVGLQSKLKEMYGLTGEEFSKALSQGRISAEAVNFALIELTDAGGQYANGAIAQSDTLAGKFSTLVDGIEMVAKAIGEKMQPALKRVLDLANQALARILQVMAAQSIDDKTKQGFKSTAEKLVRQQAGFMPGGPFGAGQVTVRSTKEFEGISREFTGSASGVVSQITNALINQRVANLTRTATPDLPVSQQVTKPSLLQGTSAGGGSKTSALKEARELERLDRERKRHAERMNDLELKKREAFNAELDKLGKENALIQARIDGTLEEERTKQRIAQLEERFADFDTSSLERLVLQGDELRRQHTEQELAADRQKQAAERIASVYAQIGQTIQSGIVSGIQAAVFQTQTLAEVASNTLNNLANQLLKMGVNMLLGSLGGALGGPFAQMFPQMAEGGRAQAGRSYIVGERGPELFTPGGTGTITPNHALMGGGSIVVNVDASGSAVEGEGAQAKQLGNVIGVAVRQELLKQKRPGGLLA